ncbi:hypothetical protein ACFW2M_18330 [Streptomyces albidoflavus]|uniref:hypothetical protein n=1 Tax=Streptomyces albidoflavus TaxID=1886 RepID=UPI00332B9EBD
MTEPPARLPHPRRHWTPGTCWRCEAREVPVLWLGPVQTSSGTGSFTACDPCVRRLETYVRHELALRDTAPAF